MSLGIAYSKIKLRNLVLINNDTYQRETLSERSIRQRQSFKFYLDIKINKHNNPEKNLAQKDRINI